MTRFIIVHDYSTGVPVVLNVSFIERVSTESKHKGKRPYITVSGAQGCGQLYTKESFSELCEKLKAISYFE